MLKNILNVLVDSYAHLQRFSFPPKYSWRWKLDMLLGKYEPETTRLIKQIVKRGDIVIDIGAHIGYFTRLASRQVGSSGRVYAFEPDTENRTLLMQNTKRYRNVLVHAAAITEKEGRAPFYHVEGSTGCHSTIAQEHAERLEVPSITLDAFMQETGTGHADVIKMDIEGGELNALRGMERTLALKPRLIIEYNPEALVRAGNAPETLPDSLAAHGFKLHAITRSGPIPLAAPFSLTLESYLEKGSVNVYCMPI